MRYYKKRRPSSTVRFIPSGDEVVYTPSTGHPTEIQIASIENTYKNVVGQSNIDFGQWYKNNSGATVTYNTSTTPEIISKVFIKYNDNNKYFSWDQIANGDTPTIASNEYFMFYNGNTVPINSNGNTLFRIGDRSQTTSSINALLILDRGYSLTLIEE